MRPRAELRTLRAGRVWRRRPRVLPDGACMRCSLVQMGEMLLRTKLDSNIGQSLLDEKADIACAPPRLFETPRHVRAT